MLIRADILKTCSGLTTARLKSVLMGNLKARVVPIKPKSPIKTSVNHRNRATPVATAALRLNTLIRKPRLNMPKARAKANPYTPLQPVFPEVAGVLINPER